MANGKRKSSLRRKTGAAVSLKELEQEAVERARKRSGAALSAAEMREIRKRVRRRR